MNRGEKIFIILLFVVLTAIIIFEIADRKGVTLPLPAAKPDDVPPDVGPAYLTMNQPGFNPGPPVFNVLPKAAQAVATQGSCNSCS